jgi:hypothetical protein
MINIKELEDRLQEILKTETGKPFNKFITETRTELMIDSINNCKERNLEIEQHKYELVIDGAKIVRLLDVEDGDKDYYWVYNEWIGLLGTSNKTGKYLASCVCEHIRLKGYIPKEDYDRLVYNWNLNNSEKAI